MTRPEHYREGFETELARFSSRFQKNKEPATGQITPVASLSVNEPLWTSSFVRIWIFNLLLCCWAFMVSASFPFYIIDLGGTELLVGITAGGYAIAALMMRPFAGWFLDNRSRSGLLLWGALLLIAISVLLLFIPVLSIVIVLRIVSGFLFSGTGTSSTTNVYDTIKQNRFGEGLGFLGLGNTLANALGPALGLAIIAGPGFPPMFAVSVAIMFFAALIMKGFPFKKVIRAEKSPERTKNVFSTLFSKDALPAAVVMFFSAIPYAGVSVFIALYGEFSGLGSGALYFALVAVGTGSTRLISGRIADKKGEKPMILAGNSALFLAMLLLLPDFSASYYLSGLFFGLGYGVSIPAMQAMSMRVVPMEKRGSASCTYHCAYDIASGIGGFLAGGLVTVWGYKTMFVSFCIFNVFSVLAYMVWASKTPSAFKVYQRNLLSSE